MSKMRKVKPLSLKQLLIYSFSSIILISLLVLGSISYYISYNGFVDVSKSYNQRLLKQLSNNIDLYFEDIVRKTDTLMLTI